MSLSSDEKRRMRSAARLYAVQALFQMEASGSAVDRVTREFETHRFGETLDDAEMAEGHVDLFRKIATEAVNHQARIDQMTDRALVAKWPIDRIDPTIRALFRAAGAELVATDTPRQGRHHRIRRTSPTPSSRRAARRPSSTPVLDHMAREAPAPGLRPRRG
jgi:N utilization substance protein B